MDGWFLSFAGGFLEGVGGGVGFNLRGEVVGLGEGGGEGGAMASVARGGGGADSGECHKKSLEEEKTFTERLQGQEKRVDNSWLFTDALVCGSTCVYW